MEAQRPVFAVEGAGAERFNGMYVRDGSLNGKPRYHKLRGVGEEETSAYIYHNGTVWQMSIKSGSLECDHIAYTCREKSSTPPTQGWSTQPHSFQRPADRDGVALRPRLLHQWRERELECPPARARGLL